MNLIALLASICLVGFSGKDVSTVDLIDLSGEWNISGVTSYGNLNYNVDLDEYGNSLDFTEVSSYGSRTSRKVTYYSNNGSSITIKIKGDDGMGRYTTTFKLNVSDSDLLKGTVKTKVEGIYGLSGFSYSGRISFKRL